ncbi:disease resistance protein RPV1-like [Rosa rugosa]|uniref:disease resistance protein RPV1-like n=1 Tax=Rosa rugosa TaxID=74645 RepID=UPI002B40B47A|nr:disease resistance protein RPV1-like [Rosa rugosa]
MTTQTDTPSSSAPLPPIPKYGVFLSSSGEDTDQNFTDHLCTALNQEGILTLRDGEELERGKAIEESRCAIVVLSENYNHPWCLDAIAKIVECKEVMMKLEVLPVFLDVNPSDVRKQTGDHFGEAFSKHEEAFKHEPEKVRRWRRALTSVANLSGWVVRNGHDAKVIQEMTEGILREFFPRIPSVPEGLVGMDSHLNEMLSYLELGWPGVHTVGIWGMGGIGKTTIAKAVYERIYSQFEGHVFLENVRESSRKPGGLVGLQEELLSKLLRWDHVNVSDTSEGISMIRERLTTRMVLIVVDDVDEIQQLEVLCDHSWFGSGSRIIITSRDEHVLTNFGVEKIYKVNALSDVEALQLFCSRAFKKDQIGEDFLRLSKEFVKYAAGLPLALQVLAASLCGKEKTLWSSALDRLKQKPDRQIMNVLKVSYDELDKMEKEIFLHIACFFKGENVDRVERILRVDYYPNFGIRVLLDRSLVTVVGRKLWMHDLLQQLGKEIVFQECLEEPGNRSRLWVPQEIIHVLEKNKGSTALQAIALDFPKTEEIHCHSEAFSVMPRLEFLQIRNVHMKEGPSYLPGGLVVLEWSGYPIESLPQNFNPKRLCELNLCYSSIEQLWSGIKKLPYLTVINLSYSWKLIRTPDFTHAPGLERLILEGCTSLVDIHPSIAHLERLISLNLKDCRSLASLPSKLEMKCLQILVLSGCSKVKKIPDFVGSMEGLLELYLDGTAIEQIPLSVRLLTGLILLNLRDCKNLKRLPGDIGNLKSLKRLNICGCSKLETLPDSLGKIDCLKELDATGGSSISNIPSSISRLESLEVLSLCGCKGMSGNMTRYPLSFLLHKSDSGGLRSLTELNLSDCNLQEGSIPDDFGCLFPLVSLNLSKNNFVSLPKSIRQLSKLRNLNLESCKTLQKLPDLSSSINFSFGAEGSISQERLSSCFNLINCSKLVVNQRCNNIALKMLSRFLQGIPSAGNRFETIIPGSEISELFSDQSVEPVISMELPRQWHKNKWMGYAFCACFVIRRDLPVPANRLGKWKFGTHSTANGLRCEVKPENLGVAGWCPSFACSQELGQIESEHLWLSFVSGDYFGTAWQETCHNIEFTFKTLGTGMEVKKCGVRLIYEQDLDLTGMKR